MDFAVGSIVWSSMSGKIFWPAIVVSPNQCNWKTLADGKRLVFWFGDHRVSEVFCRRMHCFKTKFPMYYAKGAKRNSKTWHKGVHEAIQTYASNSRCTLDLTVQSAIQWAQNGFVLPNKQCFYHLNVPLSVSSKLKIIAKNVREANDGDHLTEYQKEMQLKLKNRKVSIDEVCLCCYQQNFVDDHPLFEGKACELCLDSLRTKMYCNGDDGINYFCAICTRRGEVIICDNVNCGRVYCKDCIETLCAKDAFKTFVRQDPWKCFLCMSYRIKWNGLVKKRKNWKERVANLFSISRAFPFDDFKVPLKKRAMRVLSLFDGIGTALLVLDKLNISVQKYYSSEIDEDANNVIRMHFGNRAEAIGDVRKITKKKLSLLGPIDLLLGGSPCNDLSLVNPSRKGLCDSSGTGILFFEFYRILNDLKEMNNGKPIFWLFENVASMPVEIKTFINRFLGCNPVVLDAQWFSPQHRARLFWGNLPSLYSEHKFKVEFDNTVILDNYLVKNCNRSATIHKLRTITTNPNSLKQGPNKIYPVNMDGEMDTIWITELEEVFGFPRHYTDVANFPTLRRQKLLGKAWSVPVIEWILQCLKSFFKSN